MEDAYAGADNVMDRRPLPFNVTFTPRHEHALAIVSDASDALEGL